MAELIEFYRPSKKAKAAAPDVPAPSSAAMPVEDDEAPTAKTILSTLLANSGPVEDIVVIMRLNDGKLDFLGNLPDLEEVLLIMEDLKFKIMHFRNSEDDHHDATS